MYVQERKGHNPAIFIRLNRAQPNVLDQKKNKKKHQMDVKEAARLLEQVICRGFGPANHIIPRSLHRNC